jgi:SAM-dependent methyltransferase
MESQSYSLQIELEDSHWWYTGRRRILSQTVSRLGLAADAEILDAGCGAGGNRSVFSARQRVYGMEMDIESRARALQRGYIDVQFGSLPDQIPFPGKPFDLITMFDVLEHIEEDLASLVALRKRLKEGGWLLITVPAYRFMWSVSDDLAHHKRRYFRSGLRRLAIEAGFREEYTSYFNTVLFPAIAGMRIVKNVLGSTTHDLTRHSGLVNSVLGAAFSSERILVGRRIRLPFGVSLILIARNAG